MTRRATSAETLKTQKINKMDTINENLSYDNIFPLNTDDTDKSVPTSEKKRMASSEKKRIIADLYEFAALESLHYDRKIEEEKFYKENPELAKTFRIEDQFKKIE
jgi:hypothetical protein